MNSKNDKIEIPTPENNDVDEVFKYFGMAVYFSQVLEKGIVNLAAILKINNVPKVDDKLMRKLLDGFSRRTFGQLLKIAKETNNISKENYEILLRACQKRNYLIHEFFFQHTEDFYSESGRRLMLKELCELAEYFIEIDNISESIYEPIGEIKLGVTREMLEKSISDMEKRAKKRDGAT